ncbi:hypothetical protein PRIC2_014620 [Phytophthora ramorum]
MRLHVLAYLSAAAFLASADATPPVAHSTFTTSTLGRPAIADQNNEPAKRLLRTDLTVEKGEGSDEEERLYIPGLETATNYLKSMIGPTVASPKQLKAWLVGGESSDDVFKFLKLDQAGDNLLTNPNLDGWTTYLKLYNLNHPGKETSMIKTFTAAYGDDALAKILQSAKSVPSTKTMAEELQVAQFTQWLAKGFEPKDVYSSIFKLQPNTWREDPGAIILHQYNQFYKAHL